MAFAASTNAPRVKEAELARLLGVSRQSINELVKRDVLTKSADGLIDVELARVAIANRVRPSSKTSQAVAEAAPATVSAAPDQTPTSAEVMSYHVAKTLREVAEAKMAQLKLTELQGDLIRTDAVRHAYSRRVASLREALMQIPARLSPVLAAESDPARIHDHLLAELRQVLLQVTTN
jgi:hypothetical protein